MQIAAYAAGGAVAGVLFFRWGASKFMALCDETWDASIVMLRLEMGLYLTAICGTWGWLDYGDTSRVLAAVGLWLFGMAGVIFR